MSSGASVPPYVFTQKGTFDAPFPFDVPGSLEVRPDTAHAIFDGTGASGDFLACLTFIDSDGNVLARQFNPDGVKQGQVMEVTFIPPFGSAATSAAPSGSGIQFGIDNEGNWLEIGVDDIVPVGGAKGILFKNSGNDVVGVLLDVEALQQNPATAGLFALLARGNVDDGTSSHPATGVLASAGQFGGGPAIAVDARTSAGADLTGLKVSLTGDVGANKKGILTDSPVCFDADQGPATGTPVLAQLYLKAAGGGQHSLIARAGTTEVTLVTG